MGYLLKRVWIVFMMIAWLPALKAQPRNGLERLVEKFYSILEGDSAKPRQNYLFFLPIWAVTPETGIKLGISTGYMFKVKRDSITRPSLIRLNSSYTQYGQFNIRPTADVFFHENEYNLKAQYVFNDFNEYYWGIGNTAPDTAKELYDFRQHKAYLKFTKQVFTNWYAGPQLQYEKLYDTHFKSGSATPASGVSGVNGYSCLGAGIIIAFDNRDKIYYPLKGAYLELSNVYYFNTGFTSHSFSNYSIDLRKYIRLWKKNVLAVQGIGSFNNGAVPYRQMGTMGSEMMMRGYYNGRFRDLHFTAVQAEFRKTIWGPLGITFFGGVGNVGNSGSDLLSNMKPSYGFGLRGMAVRREHLNVRLDFGFGQGKIKGFYFTMGEAF